MNFQQVEQANGNLVTMFGAFTEIGGTQYTSNRAAKAICKIRDDTGETHTVHIYQGKGQLPGTQQLNQRCQFSLSTFQGTRPNGSYTGYSGFWNSGVQVNQSNQQAPPQQGLPPQKTKQDKPDWDAIAEGKVRHGIVCAAIQSGQIKIADEGNIEYWKNYIINGEAKPQGGNPNPDYDENPEQSLGRDDIPF